MDKESFIKLKPGEWFKFQCLKCNKEVESKKKDFKKGQLDQLRFLCKTCKSKETSLKRYGVENPSQSQEVKDKVKDSNLKKYGVGNVSKLDSVRNRISESTKLFWKSLPEEVKSNRLENLSLKMKVYWDSLSEEERQAISEKFSAINKETWDKATLEIKERHSLNIKAYWDSLTSEDLVFVSQRNSRNSKSFWSNLTEEQRNQISEKRQLYWKNLTKEQRLEIRRKSNKHNKYKSSDGEVFDSLWELKYYEYCQCKGFNIIREPVELEFYFEGKTYHCYPDFEVEGKLIEIKGSQFLVKDKMVNPYDRNQNGLYEAKHKCMLENNVKFLFKEDLIELGIKL